MISYTDDVRNGEVLQRVINEEGNILEKIKRKLPGLVIPCVELASKTQY
jgi:hypothetical protein